MSKKKIYRVEETWFFPFMNEFVIERYDMEHKTFKKAKQHVQNFIAGWKDVADENNLKIISKIAIDWMSAKVKLSDGGRMLLKVIIKES